MSDYQGDFTTSGDVRKLYKGIDTVQLTDTDIGFYIQLAESTVKGYIAKRYALPFTDVPVLVRNISVELSLLKILDRFFTVEDEATQSNEHTTRAARWKRLIKTLEGIADGTIALVDSNDVVITPRADIHGISAKGATQYTPTFGHGSPVDEIVDEDRIEDEEKARD